MPRSGIGDNGLSRDGIGDGAIGCVALDPRVVFAGLQDGLHIVGSSFVLAGLMTGLHPSGSRIALS